MPRRRAGRVAGLAVAAALLAGCGFHGIYSLPLPGAAASGGNTYNVVVQFADVSDLVPYSAVKVDYATVGHVSAINLRNRVAYVVCRLPDRVQLPANAVARVEQTSLLGEKFVEIEAPTSVPPQGRLVNGSVIPLSRTDTSASVEEVLGALSALLNGGGLAQVHTIVRQLNVALGGREPAARAALAALTAFSRGLNGQKTDILGAIAGLDRLTGTIRTQESTVTAALDRMPAALGTLAADEPRLTRLLTAMQGLGAVAVHVESAAGTQMVSDLRELVPTAQRLAQVGTDIPKSLQLLFTYPTADGVEKAFFGDYGNLYVTIDLSKSALQHNFAGAGPPAAGPRAPSAGSHSRLPLPVPTPTLPLPLPPAPTPTAPGGILPTLPGVQLSSAVMFGWDSGDIAALLLGALR